MAELGADSCSTVLPETAQAVELGRRFAQAALLRADYRGRHEDILLIASELVTNALRHGRGAPQLFVMCSADGTRVRLEVVDDNPAVPSQRPCGPDGGFGLMVLSRLGRWGTAPRGVGKAVWCEVETADMVMSPAGRAPASSLAVSP
jgi:anti-sigma regulatory factor (Ser/Thr protein kinase)